MKIIEMEPNERVHSRINTAYITASGVSDPGRLRSENQDAIFLEASGYFMLLADGMGGHERGSEASKTVIDVIQRFLSPEVLLEKAVNITNGETLLPGIMHLSSLVEDAIRKANSLLYERNSQANLQRFMGTTIVGLIPVQGNKMLWFNVGDSRLYRWRDAILKRLTSDHSAYWEWERNGRLGPEPSKNIITRAIGPHKIVSADIGWDKWLKDDIYILCSDGLSDMLTENQILHILNAHKDVDHIAVQLLDAANDAGGKDNISVVVCKV